MDFSHKIDWYTKRVDSIVKIVFANQMVVGPITITSGSIKFKDKSLIEIKYDLIV